MVLGLLGRTPEFHTNVETEKESSKKKKSHHAFFNKARHAYYDRYQRNLLCFFFSTASSFNESNNRIDFISCSAEANESSTP
jgi:hypothetical protein